MGAHAHHGGLSPVGVMGAHTHGRGDWMLSYRYMHMDMGGNRDGSSRSARRMCWTSSWSRRWT
ncbi:MAG: hypothetical protein ACOCVU_02235 [Desulfohalobiaceae bacterium]